MGIRQILRTIIRNAGWVTTIALALSIVGAFYSVKLYKNLRPDIEELLPLKSRSVQNYFEVSSRLESTDYMAVLLFPKDKTLGRRFASALATELKKAPRNVVARIEYRIQDTLDFFKKRRALYLEVQDLRKIRDYIRDRIEYEKALYNPLNIFSGIELPEPNLDFRQLEMRYSSKTGSFAQLPDGYFATQDESVFAVLAYLPSGGSKIEASHKLEKTVHSAIDSVFSNEPAFRDVVDVKFTGGVQDLIEEHASLIADLELSTLLVFVLVSAIILIYYRSFRASFALVVSLFAGSLWCFGVSYWVVGYLNANSAFLGAIILGNGVNFGIIFLARYVEELEKRSSNARALYRSAQTTATATWTAALAAGLAYGSLALTEFRGFRQFGIIGLIGMVLCWLSAFIVMPALLVLIDRIWPVTRYSWKRNRSILNRGFSRIVIRWPGWIITIAAAAIVYSASLLVSHYKGSDELLETNLSKLRDRRSEESGSGYNSKYLHQIFQGYPQPTVILTANSQEAKQVGEALRRKQATKSQRSYLASVQSLYDLVPENQAEKIQLIADIKRHLNPAIMRRLSSQDKARAAEFLNGEVQKPVTKADLPDFVKHRISEKNGAIGNLVLVNPTIGITEQLEGLLGFVDEIRSVVDSIRPGIPVAGQLAISADMIRAIRRDGPKATLASLLAVIVLVCILFRKIRLVVPVIASLLLGVFWLAGVIIHTELKINFLNFIALPITFGIGVDYGVNVFQRYCQQRDGDIRSVLKQTAGAVTLASMTTIIGYGSLLLAGNRAFVSLGILAVWGEVTCLISAIVVLPAALAFFVKRSSIQFEVKSSSTQPPNPSLLR